MECEAYIDEAGAKGLLRNLDTSTDDDIALLSAIVIPKQDRLRFYNALSEPFDKFKAARPSGVDKLHITDAFKPGNEAWAAVANEARSDIFSYINELQIPIIYDARRLKIARESFESLQAIKEKARKLRQSDIRMSNHPSDERIEENCMVGLALKLDAFAEDSGNDTVNLITDQIDSNIALLFRDMIERTQKVSQPDEYLVKGYDLKEKKQVYGTIRFEIKGNPGQNLPSLLDSRYIGALDVLGKDDPLVFAADVVANALYYHLNNLPKDAPLNHPTSISDWELGSRVYGVREDALEDKI